MAVWFCDLCFSFLLTEDYTAVSVTDLRLRFKTESCLTKLIGTMLTARSSDQSTNLVLTNDNLSDSAITFRF